MTWTLFATDTQTVAWQRDDGVVIKFVRQGFGEPWSDDKKPPDSIDSFAPPRTKPLPTEIELQEVVAMAESLQAALVGIVAQAEKSIADLALIIETKGK